MDCDKCKNRGRIPLPNPRRLIPGPTTLCPKCLGSSVPEPVRFKVEDLISVQEAEQCIPPRSKANQDLLVIGYEPDPRVGPLVSERLAEAVRLLTLAAPLAVGSLRAEIDTFLHAEARR